MVKHESLTPKQIVAELDKYIIGQSEAKKSVAIALRNRIRRTRLSAELQEEIIPKNIIMIGPTGVGKTEISRRLAKIADAPFIKVEATRYTEVGYVGRDVESIVRDLLEIAINMVKAERMETVRAKAEESVEEQLLDLLLPPRKTRKNSRTQPPAGTDLPDVDWQKQEEDRWIRTRNKIQEQLAAGLMEDHNVELEIKESTAPMVEILGVTGFDENIGKDFRDMLGHMMPAKNKDRKMTVAEARRVLMNEEMEKLIDREAAIREAIQRVESSGIVFLDEIDKIAGRESGRSGPEVSREGVQRDLLPIIEGATVNSKHGMVDTRHILFIAAGAFNVAKPSDLIPELQGRFPIRVELKSLTRDDFVRILTQPQNALIKQYTALLSTENVQLEFTPAAIESIAELAQKVNETMENIGARRLHTLLEKLLEDISYDAPDSISGNIIIDAPQVQEKLTPLVKDEDLSRYIL